MHFKSGSEGKKNHFLLQLLSKDSLGFPVSGKANLVFGRI